MQIIIEGISRCGKNHVAKFLANSWEGLTLYKNEHNTPSRTPDFHTVAWIESQVFATFDDFVKTRYQLSHAAFREYEGESLRPSFESLEDSCKDSVICIYISQTYERFLEHNSDELKPSMSKYAYDELDRLYRKYMDKSKFDWKIIDNDGTLLELEENAWLAVIE